MEIFTARSIPIIFTTKVVDNAVKAITFTDLTILQLTKPQYVAKALLQAFQIFKSITEMAIASFSQGH